VESHLTVLVTTTDQRVLVFEKKKIITKRYVLPGGAYSPHLAPSSQNKKQKLASKPRHLGISGVASVRAQWKSGVWIASRYENAPEDLV
jgi:hypothetical protein